MNLLLVIATDEQNQLESALRGQLTRAFPGEVHEVDATRLPPPTASEKEDLELARDLLVADAVIMLLPLANENHSMRHMQTWLHRAGVDGVTVMIEPDGITSILDEKPVFLIRPTHDEKPDEDAEPVRSARSGLALLGLSDVTVINVDPVKNTSVSNLMNDQTRLN